MDYWGIKENPEPEWVKDSTRGKDRPLTDHNPEGGCLFRWIKV